MEKGQKSNPTGKEKKSQKDYSQGRKRNLFERKEEISDPFPRGGTGIVLDSKGRGEDRSSLLLRGGGGEPASISMLEGERGEKERKE